MKKIIALALFVIVLCISLCGCESWQRSMKSMKSDFAGGLNRTVTLYSNTGEKIQSWSGKFDVSESENEIFFDVDGKRVIIHGGIVINEEITDGKEN